MFDVTEHKMIVANIFLTEVLPDGDFVFRLLGEGVIQIVGSNRKGETGAQRVPWATTAMPSTSITISWSPAGFAGCARDPWHSPAANCGNSNPSTALSPTTANGKVTFIVGVMDFSFDRLRRIRPCVRVPHPSG